MPKFFIISDVHGCYDEMQFALDKAGFDPNNEEHWLIGCGDYTDRGHQPLEVIKYLQGLPRKVLVKGNHESLLLECVDRGYPMSHDWSNGTAGTIIDLAPQSQSFDVACSVAYGKVKDFIGGMVDYFETKNHIFVHSWIPLISQNSGFYHFDPNWRQATAKQWENARWGNPYELAEQGLNKTGKTIVFGHWHCSTGWSKAENRSVFGPDAKFEPYYGKGFISIDACTAYSKKCNVIVIEDEFMEG